MLVHQSVFAPALRLSIYSWVERESVKVKCLAQEHCTETPARARTGIAPSGSNTLACLRPLHFIKFLFMCSSLLQEKLTHLTWPDLRLFVFNLSFQIKWRPVQLSVAPLKRVKDGPWKNVKSSAVLVTSVTPRPQPCQMIQQYLCFYPQVRW